MDQAIVNDPANRDEIVVGLSYLGLGVQPPTVEEIREFAADKSSRSVAPRRLASSQTA